MKKIAVFLLLAMLLTLLCGCDLTNVDIPVPPVIETEPTLTLGVITDLTDERKSPEEAEPDGVAFYYGVQCAVNEAVEMSRAELKVVLLRGDIKGDITKAKSILSEMIAKGVDAVVCNQVIAKKIVSTAEKNDVLLMVPDADEQGVSFPKKDDEDQTPDSLVRKHKNVYTILPDGKEYGKIAAFYAKLQNYAKVLVVYDKNDVFWKDAADSFTEALEGYGKKVVESKEINFDNADLTRETMEKLCERNTCDAIFLGCPFDRAVLSGIPGANYGGCYGKCFCYSAATNYQVALETKDGGYHGMNNECLLSIFSNIPKKGHNDDFYNKYETLYGETASFSSAIAYDAASVVIAAALKAGGGDFDSLCFGLRDLRYDGVTGLVRYADDSGFVLRSLYGMSFSYSYESESYTTRIKYPSICLREDALEIQPEEPEEAEK